MNIHPDHRDDLYKSGITDETIGAAGIFSVPPDKIKKALGWNAPVTSLLAFPYGNGFTRYKLFPPLINKEGRAQKYSQQKGSGLHLYLPPKFDIGADCLRITEGEKKALKGSQEGLNVSALGGIWNFGAKDADSGLTRLIDDLKALHLKGKLLEIIPDGDFQLKEPVAHAVYRFGTLLEVEGAAVRIVALPAFDKLDEYLCKHSTEDFLSLPRLTLDDPFFRPYVVKEKGLSEAIIQGVMSSSEFLSLRIKPRAYYLKPWLRSGSLAMIYAQRGIGKSFLCIIIALCITRKLDLGNWQAGEPAPVLYIDGEMAAEELQDRFRLLSACLPPEIAPLHILSAESMQGNGWPTPNLADSKWREALYSFLKESFYRVLILDNIASLTPGIPENEKESWDEINRWLLSLRWNGMAVILVHHAGKSGDQRGTSGREDNLDIVIRLSRPAGYRPEDGARFDCEFTKARGVYGDSATPFSIHLVGCQDGNLTWGAESAGAQTRQLIIALLGNGIPQREIPGLLGVQRAWVSKVKKTAIKDGYLTEYGEFTDEGNDKYGGISIDGLVGR